MKPSDVRQLDFEGKQHRLPVFLEGHRVEVVSEAPCDEEYQGRQGPIVKVQYNGRSYCYCVALPEDDYSDAEEQWFSARDLKKVG